MVKRRKKKTFIYGIYTKTSPIASLPEWWAETKKEAVKCARKYKGTIGTFNRGNLNFYYGKMKKAHKC